MALMEKVERMSGWLHSVSPHFSGQKRLLLAH